MTQINSTIILESGDLKPNRKGNSFYDFNIPLDKIIKAANVAYVNNDDIVFLKIKNKPSPNYNL